MDFKKLLIRTTSLVLIGAGAYQVLLSLNAIFFVYPHLDPRFDNSVIVQEGFIEKALILYTTMVLDGIYGIGLLLKPTTEVKLIHALAAIVLAIVSIFFITQTPFTTDPLFYLLKNLPLPEWNR